MPCVFKSIEVKTQVNLFRLFGLSTQKRIPVLNRLASEVCELLIIKWAESPASNNTEEAPTLLGRLD